MRQPVKNVGELKKFIKDLPDNLPVRDNYAGIGSPANISVEETKTKIEPGEPEVLSLLFSI